jgi:hypothetical protein
MLSILAYTIFLYLVLKVMRLMIRPAVGPDRDERSFGAILGAGEPNLLIGVFGLATLITIYTTWWAGQFNRGEYSYSTDCYAKLAASHHLPARPVRFGSWKAADAASGYVELAEIHGAKLGLGRDAIDRKLTQAMTARAAYYTDLAAKNARPKIAASFNDLDRCLKGEGHPKGEILTPNV